MSERIKFKADDNLLKQVITDQAGEWKKGILELLQNSYDSIVMRETPTKEPRIDLRVGRTSDGLHFLEVEDNGCGWGKTKEEVIRNMQIFGNSIKKQVEGTIGEKGMGRGQAMAMIYSVAQDEFVGDIVIQTNGWEIYDIRLSDLSFSIRKQVKGEDGRSVKRRGTRWIITSPFREFDNLEDEIREFINDNIMLPVTITLNGKLAGSKIGGVKWETDEAVFYVSQGKGVDQGRPALCC